MLKKKEMNWDPPVKTDPDQTAEDDPAKESSADANRPLEKMSPPELLEKIKQLSEESKKNYDLYLRSQAEMENVRKRNKRDREEWLKYANESLIKEILPIMDNLERAIAHCQNDVSLTALREGVELTLKNLQSALIKSGVEEVKSCGEDFDPCYHEAIAELADEKAGPGTVLQEFQKGYLLNKRLLRPAKVVVCKAAQTQPNQTANPEGVCEKSIES
ncbi:MAG: nucleotide exchange factor GrpE [Desulfobacteraceae bacterium]|nr:MAG: nucleotide exchange factor GrpE [Desulfobacteraceae bacterium]